jgi:hypothetical protein
MNVARLTLVGREPSIPPHVLRRDPAIIAAVSLAAGAYATLRYNVCKGVPWADWPSDTLNKRLAVTSLLLLTGAGLRRFRRTGSSAVLMTWGFAAALGHLLLSFALFQPRYFDKLFAAGKLSFAGGASMAAGRSLMSCSRSAGAGPGSGQVRRQTTCSRCCCFLVPYIRLRPLR